jgi:hypothetical protein
MVFLLIGLVFVAVMLSSPVGLWVDYRHRGKTEDSLLLKVSLLWGIGHYTVQVPVISSSDKGVSVEAEAGKKKSRFRLSVPSLGQIKQSVKHTKGWLHWFYSFSRRVIRIKQFVWHTELGLVDSARLAQITGALWAVKGTVSAGLQKLFRFAKPPVLRVRPSFNRSYFRTVFTCILEFPLGYIIIVGLFIIAMVIKVKLSKRGEVNVGTSNPRPDENSHGKHQRNGRRQYSHR